MATKIRNKQVRQQLLRDLHLSEFADKIPDMLANAVIVPVIDATPKGVQIQIKDSTVNTQDFFFTVPTNKEWIVKAISITSTTDGTAGNRRLEVKFADPTNANMFEIAASHAIASNTTFITNFMIGGPTTISTNVDSVNPLPNVILRSGSIVEVVDESGISAGDDHVVKLWIQEFEVSG